MFLKKEKVNPVSLDKMDSLLKVSLRSIGKENKNILTNVSLIRQLHKKEKLFELSTILDYIAHFGEERYLSIVNDKSTFKRFFKTESIHTRVQPSYCNNDKSVFWYARQSAYRDYLNDNNFEIKLVREPDNPYDSNAIAVYAGEKAQYHVGHISRQESRFLAPKLDKKFSYNLQSTIEEYDEDDYASPLYLDVSIYKN